MYFKISKLQLCIANMNIRKITIDKKAGIFFFVLIEIADMNNRISVNASHISKPLIK